MQRRTQVRSKRQERKFFHFACSYGPPLTLPTNVFLSRFGTVIPEVWGVTILPRPAISVYPIPHAKSNRPEPKASVVMNRLLEVAGSGIRLCPHVDGKFAARVDAGYCSADPAGDDLSTVDELAVHPAEFGN